MPSDEEFRTWNQTVIAEFRANGGSVSQPDFPILLLTTTGARSGRRTTTPLAYGIDNGQVFVVASKGGAPQHPAWYHNVTAHPEVIVEIGRNSVSARAIEIQGAERDRLYALISKQVPAFRGYERTSTRVFPVISLDGVPVPAGVDR
jgi:deazaflavin-dependent oxidoreductase (nitroreductase family)